MSKERADHKTRFKPGKKGISSRTSAISVVFRERVDTLLRSKNFLEKWTFDDINDESIPNRSDLIREAVEFYLAVPKEWRSQKNRRKELLKIIKSHKNKT